MAVTGAVAAVVGASYGVYAGERGAKIARKGRRRQAQAQKQAMTQKTAGAARARGRERQARVGKQLAMVQQTRIGAPAAGGISKPSSQAASDVAAVGSRTFG